MSGRHTQIETGPSSHVRARAEATPASLRRAADEVSKTIPNATLRIVPKQNHGIKPAALRPVLVELFA